MSFIKKFWYNLAHEDFGMTAAALSFTTVLALVPFIAVTLAALNIFESLDALVPKVEVFLLQNLQGTAGTEGLALLRKVIQRIQDGKIGTLGAIFLVLTATRMMFELDRAVHRIWRIKNSRSFLNRLFIYWFVLLIFPFGLALWVSIFGTKTIAQSLAQILPFGSGFLIIFLLLLLIIKGIPSIRVNWLSALIGTGFSCLALYSLQKTFKIISVQVFSYGKIYGSLASIPASLIWILLIWVSILIGVSISASLQKS